jgi:hypothetical protein
MSKNTRQQPSHLHNNRHLQNGDVVSCAVSDDHDCAYVTHQLGLDDDVSVAAYDVAQALYFSSLLLCSPFPFQGTFPSQHLCFSANSPQQLPLHNQGHP